MSDDALIRLTNLKALGLSASELQSRIGNSYQYWRDLLAGRKSFGEKAARNIEEKLGLLRGSLDTVSGSTELTKEAHNPPALKTQTLAEALAFIATNLASLEPGMRRRAYLLIADLERDFSAHAEIAAAIESMTNTAKRAGK